MRIIAALFILGIFCLSLFKIPVSDSVDTEMYICCSNLTDDFY